LSQRRLAAKTGLSLRTLQRVEPLEMDNPRIRYLANCAIVLGCVLEDLIEPA
jgi:transcriptional regulator with XRE-family HTH domain